MEITMKLDENKSILMREIINEKLFTDYKIVVKEDLYRYKNEMEKDDFTYCVIPSQFIKVNIRTTKQLDADAVKPYYVSIDILYPEMKQFKNLFIDTISKRTLYEVI